MPLQVRCSRELHPLEAAEPDAGDLQCISSDVLFLTQTDASAKVILRVLTVALIERTRGCSTTKLYCMSNRCRLLLGCLGKKSDDLAACSCRRCSPAVLCMNGLDGWLQCCNLIRTTQDATESRNSPRQCRVLSRAAWSHCRDPQRTLIHLARYC